MSKPGFMQFMKNHFSLEGWFVAFHSVQANPLRTGTIES